MASRDRRTLEMMEQAGSLSPGWRAP